MVRAALEEDLGRAGDITCELTIPAEPERASAGWWRASRARIAGLIAAECAFRLVDPALRL